MSTLDLSPLRSTLNKYRTIGRMGQSPLVSQSEMELQPYYESARNDVVSERRKIQPLRWLFDLLSRGQYMTANVAKEVIQSARTGESLGQATADALRGALQGVTGKRKGDWETVIFGGQDEGDAENFTGIVNPTAAWTDPLIKFPKKGPTGETRGILRPRKVVGLAANILLDPTTYLGGAGATKAAKRAASDYAMDVAKMELRSLMTDPAVAKALGDKAPKTISGIQKAMQTGAKSTALRKHLDDLYRASYKEGLQTPASELVKRVGERIQKLAGKAESTPVELMETMKRVSDVNAYKGAGERAAFSIAGRPFGVGERQPWVGERAFESLKGWMGTSRPGKFLKDAWWALLNNPQSPVAAVRSKLGIRNAYEGALHALEMSKAPGYAKTAYDLQAGVDQLAKDLTDEERKLLRDVRVYAHRVNVPGEREVLSDDVFDMLINGVRSTPRAGQKMIGGPTPSMVKGVKPERLPHLREVNKRLQSLLDELRTKENFWAESAGSSAKVANDLNYFPTVLRPQKKGMSGGASAGPFAPRHTKTKKMDLEVHLEDARQNIKDNFGDYIQEVVQRSNGATTEDDVVTALINKGMGYVVEDPIEALRYRMIAHAKLQKRFDLVNEFKSFGVSLDQVAEAYPDVDIAAHLRAGDFSDLGLVQVNDPSMKGMLFDPDVAAILDRSLAAMAAPQAQGVIKEFLGNFTSWWKGMVTLSTGFHARNAMSNQMAGFLQHGTKWLEFGRDIDATIGMLYALNPEKYIDILTKEFSIPQGQVLARLNRVLPNGMTLRETAEEAVRSGVVSRSTKGWESAADMDDLLNRVQSVNPLSRKGPAMKFSRRVGDILENQSKLKSFMINLEDMAGGAQKLEGQLLDDVVRAAATDTKKWFVDYGDLTPFEQNILRDIIPFYSWVRHNLANQINGIILHPDMYSLIPKTMTAATSDEDFDYELQPDWQKQLAMFPVGRDPDTGNWIMFRPDFPFRDINLIPARFEEGSILPRWEWKEAVNDIMQAIHPTLRTIMEIAPDRGWNYFQRREIRDQEPAPAAFQYLAKFLSDHPGALGFLDGVLRMAGAKQGVKVDLSKDRSRVTMDGKMVQILQNNMPALRTLATIAEGGEEAYKALINPDIERLIEKVSGKQDYYEGLEEALQVVSTWGGVKFQQLEEEKERERLMEEAMNRAQKALSDYRRGTAEGKRRSAETIARLKAKARRLESRATGS